MKALGDERVISSISLNGSPIVVPVVTISDKVKDRHDEFVRKRLEPVPVHRRSQTLPNSLYIIVKGPKQRCGGVSKR